MTSFSVIENKISSILKYLKILNGYKQYLKAEIEKDLNLKGALERYLYLVTQATIDLAEAVISYRDFRKPATLAESFQILNEEKIISSSLTKKMISLVGFRNIIAHDYEEIDYDIVYNVLQNRLSDIEELITEIRNNLNP